MIAARVKPMFEKEARERQREHGGTAPGKSKNTSGNIAGSVQGDSRDKAASVVRVSGRSVSAAERVLASGDKELIRAVDRGEKTVAAAWDLTVRATGAERVDGIGGGSQTITP